MANEFSTMNPWCGASERHQLEHEFENNWSNGKVVLEASSRARQALTHVFEPNTQKREGEKVR